VVDGIQNIHTQDHITGASSEEIDPNYPASNALDDHPKNIARSLYDWMKMDFTVAAGAEALGIAAIRASTVSVKISSSGSIAFLSGTAGSLTTVSGVGALNPYSAPEDPLNEIFDLDESDLGALWVQFDAPLSESKNVQVYLQGAETYAEIGTAKAGLLNTWRQAVPNLEEGSKDLSSVRRLNSGALYITDRDLIRTFDFSFPAYRNATENNYSGFWDFLLSFRRRLKSNPCFWRLDATRDDGNLVVYARFQTDKSPEGSISSPNTGEISVSLEEVL